VSVAPEGGSGLAAPVDILIVTPDPTLERLRAALARDGIRVEIASSYEAAVKALKDHRRTVCAVDAACPPGVLRRVCLYAKRAAGRLVVVLGDGSQATYGSHGHYGADVDTCPKGKTLAETVLRLKALLIVAGHDAHLLTNSREPALPARSPTEEPEGSVLAVFSVKGGVGKSTVAVNLAAGLAQLGGTPPLLVDANLYFGDVAVLTNLAPKNSIADLCSQPEFDALTLGSLVTQHPAGFSILSSPADMTEVDRLNTPTLARALAAYRAMFGWVVVDTRPSLDEPMLQILDVADRILLIVTPEVSALYQTVRFLAVADALGYGDKIMVVLNRAGSGVPQRSVEEHLGHSIAASIVSGGPAVTAAANRGTPLVLEDQDQKKKITRDLVQLMHLVSNTIEPSTSPALQAQPQGTKKVVPLANPARSLLGATP
jgi:pilus assembly protein CpaE